MEKPVSSVKIIRVSTYLDYGGIESKMVNLSTFKDSNEWIFMALGKGGDAERKINSNGKKTIILNQSPKIPSIKIIIKLTRLFRKLRADVVHSSGAEANFHCLIAARLSGVKVIIAEEIGIPNHKELARKVFSLLYKRCNYVLGESIKVTDFIAANYKVDKEKVVTISNFVNPKLSIENTLKKKSSPLFRLISVCRLEPVKNIEGVLEAVKQIAIEDNIPIEYVIVGDGSLETHLKNHVNHLGIQKYVTFKGYQKNPIADLLEADLYIINSFSEGFSNSMLEAMSLGIPVLTTNVGGAKDVITNDRNGWVLSDFEISTLKNSILFIKTLPPSELRSIAEAGRNRVNKEFSILSHVQQLMNIYKK